MVEPVNDNILNLVNELYNNLDAKDKIINEQALEIARLKEKIDKAIELTKIRIESCNACLSNDETSIVSKHSLLRLEIQSYKELLEILGDKENE